MSLVKDTLKGFGIAILLLVLTWVLYQLGLVAQGAPLVLDARSPLEFWASVTGLVIQWSQFNEWLLLLVALMFAVMAALLFVRWRRDTAAKLGERMGRQPMARRVERYFLSVKGVAAIGGLAALVFAAWIYQQYLWHVALPVPQGTIGVAISRQAFSSVSIDAISSELASLGHGDAVVVRELPLGYGANDVDRGRELARRIGASAFVIVRQTDDDLTAVVAFVDPSFGLELPLSIRTPDGPASAFRAKQGIDVPQLQSRDLGRLLEAAAGLILYDQDRLTGAVEHLRQALPPPGSHEAMEPVVRFHIANAAYLLGDDATAITELRQVLDLLEGGPSVSLQDRLVFIQASNTLAHLLAVDGLNDEARTLAEGAVDAGDALLRDESALGDEGTFIRVHQAAAESFVVMAEVSSVAGDDDATTLWLSRAAEEGRALSSLHTDRRSVLAGARALYLAGQCPDAYAQALDLLHADPDDREALQMLIRIASLRDLQIGPSLEAQVDLAHLLTIGTPRLIDLRFEYIRASLDALIADRDSALLLDPITESMLNTDPTSALTLEMYVDDRRFGVGWWIDYPPWSLPPRNGGHVPTFVRKQVAMARDSSELLAIADDADTVRLSALRWAVELNPGPEAWLAVSEIDQRTFQVLYRYIPTGNLSANEDVTQRMTVVSDALFSDTDRVIQMTEASPRQAAEARLMRGLNALSRYSYSDGQIAGWPDGLSLLDTAIAELESARSGIEAEPDDEDGNLVDWQVFGYLANAYHARSGEAHNMGDDVEAARLRSLELENLEKKAAHEPTTPETFNSPLGQCIGAEDKLSAEEALTRGDTASAISDLEKYLADYPNDPAALIALARAHSENGDAVRSMQFAQDALTAASANPLVQLGTVAALVGGGQAEQANAALDAGLADLAVEPVSTRFAVLESLGRDLRFVVTRDASQRADVAAIVVAISEWLEGADVPAHAVPAYVQALDALAMASLWADDSAQASNLLERAVGLTESALIAAHRGLVALRTGDDTAFRVALDGTLAAAASYPDLGCVENEFTCSSLADHWLPFAAEWQSRDLRQAASDYLDFAAERQDLREQLAEAAARFEAAASAVTASARV